MTLHPLRVLPRLAFIISALLGLAPTRGARAAEPPYDPTLATSTTLLKLLQAGETRDAVPCPAGEKTDLWILAGQSNMYGAGETRPLDADPLAASTMVPPGVDVAAPLTTRVWMFTADHRWMPAAHPLHRLWSSLLPADRKLAGFTAEQAAQHWHDMLSLPRSEPQFWAGPGLAFGQALAAELPQPIGLIPTAHGGTTLDLWSPDHQPTSGTACLYGAMLERVRLAHAGGTGGTLRGMLWYQGETDVYTWPKGQADTPAGRAEITATYQRKFLHMVDALRRDTGVADLPILTVQLSRYVLLTAGGGDAWECVREAQRTVVAQRKNLFVVSAIDLGLDDSIHLSGASQQRLGQRLAHIALGEVYQRPGHPTGPEVATVENLNPDPLVLDYTKTVLRVRFHGVSGRLKSEGRLSGFVLRRDGGCQPAVNNPYAVEFDPADPAAVLVRAQGVTSDTVLLYGPGLDPYANITDEADMPVPGFGPLPITPAR